MLLMALDHVRETILPTPLGAWSNPERSKAKTSDRDVLKGVTENSTVEFSVTGDDGAAASPRFEDVNDVLKGVTENGTVPFSVTRDEDAAALPRFEDVVDRQAPHDWCRVIEALEAFRALRPIPHLFRNPCSQVFYAVEEALPAARGWLQQFKVRRSSGLAGSTLPDPSTGVEDKAELRSPLGKFTAYKAVRPPSRAFTSGKLGAIASPCAALRAI
jgi:hypothetical protein